MKVASGILGSHFGARLLWIALLVSLALGITLALLLTRGSATADGQDEFTAPIVLEEIRTPPKVVEPPSVRELRQVQGQGASITQQKPTSSTLISNTTKTPIATNAFDNDYAQAFTTGSHSDGYTLISVKMYMFTSGAQPGYSVAIHEDSSTPGTPVTTELGVLTKPNSLSSALKLETFTASGNGIDLDANTTYWMVLDVTGGSNTNAQVGVTGSDDEDGGGATGWSIGDNRLTRGVGVTAWPSPAVTRPASFRIAIEGYAKPPALISNMNVTGATRVTFNGPSKLAQSFTTGSNSLGYRLTSVEMLVKPNGQSNSSVFIYSGGTVPTIEIGTLTKPGSLPTTLGIVSFPASGDGIWLAGNRTYWLVADASTSFVIDGITGTTANGEDPGGAAGWGIGDDEYPLAFQNSNWVTSTVLGKFRLAVMGYAIDPSQPPRAAIEVTYTNPQGTPVAVEIKAASAERDTLWDYFYDSCQSQRTLTGVVHDYSHYTEIVTPSGATRTVMTQARNGWKWVWVQDANGAVTGTRPQTVTECASHGMYLRQQDCANDDWRNRNPHLLDSMCPDYRNW